MVCFLANGKQARRKETRGEVYSIPFACGRLSTYTGYLSQRSGLKVCRMACGRAVLGSCATGGTFANVLCNGLAVGAVVSGKDYGTSGKADLLCWPALPVLVPVAVLPVTLNWFRFRLISFHISGSGAVLMC